MFVGLRTVKFLDSLIFIPKRNREVEAVEKSGSGVSGKSKRSLR